MQMRLDNNAPLGLAISAGGAHSPEHVLTTSSTANDMPAKGINMPEVPQWCVTFVNFVKRSKER